MPNEFIARNGIISRNNLIVTGSLNVTGSLTGSSALITGNVQVLGTASINTLVVNQTQLSTGSNQLGDAANDTQTLFGTVRIPTGSLTVTGSTSIISGSLTVTADSSLSNRAILIEPSSVGTSVVRHNRSNTTSIATYEFLTGGFLKWAIGLRELGDDDYHIYNQGTGADAITIKRDNGFVGIGFLSPSASLDVSGSGRFTSGLLVTGSTIISSSNATQLQVGTNLLFVSSSGNVGVGTSSPTTVLHVNGSSAGTNPSFQIRQTSNTTPTWLSIRNTDSLGSAGAVSADLGVSGGTDQFFTGTSQGDTVFKAYSQGNSSKLFIGATAASAANIVLFPSTGNTSVGTYLDSGFKLDVSGSGIFRNTLRVLGGYAYGGSIPSSGQGQPKLGVTGRFNVINDNRTFYFDVITTGTPYAEFATYKYDDATTFPMAFQTNGGNVLINTITDSGFKLDVNGTGRFSSNLTVTGSFTVTTGSLVEFQVTNTGTKIGNAITDTHSITGSVAISSSASTSSAALQVYKSGSTVLNVEGSSGQLFSVTDSLTGSLFSVNTVAGLPVIEAFSDNTVNIGKYGIYPIKVAATGTLAVITGSFTGSLAGVSATASYVNPLTQSVLVSGSLTITGSSTGTLLQVGAAITSSIFRVSGSGNVIIGSGSVYDSRLTITGPSTFNGNLLTLIQTIPSESIRFQMVQNGIEAAQFGITGTTNSYILGAPTTADFGLRAANNIIFSTDNGNSVQMTLQKTTGNLGIGTTNPSTKLQVKGSGTTSSTTSFRVENSSATARLTILDDGTSAFNTNNLYISSSGNVGIGTSNPLALLSVGSGSLADANVPIQISTGGSGTETNYAINKNGGYGFLFGYKFGNNIGSMGTYTGGYFRNVTTDPFAIVVNNVTASGLWTSDASVYLGGILTNSSTGAGAALSIKGATGNVGIGNISPNFKLDVSGSSEFVGNVFITGSTFITASASTSSAALYVYKSGSTTVDIQGSQGQLFSVIDSLTGSLMSVNDVSGLPILEVSSDDKVVMGTYGAAGLIVTGSRVGVYTTTPSASLHVSGAFLGYPVTVATASGTASLNCSLGNFFNLTLSSSYTLFLSASNVQPGQTINLRITQPATSGSLNYGSQFKFAGGIPYTASSTGSAVDIISFITFDSTNLYGSAIKNLS